MFHFYCEIFLSSPVEVGRKFFSVTDSLEVFPPELVCLEMSVLKS